MTPQCRLRFNGKQLVIHNLFIKIYKNNLILEINKQNDDGRKDLFVNHIPLNSELFLARNIAQYNWTSEFKAKGLGYK